MRLKDVKPSKELNDLSWFFNPPKIVYTKGRPRAEIAGGPEPTYGTDDGTSYLTNPHGDLTPDEVSMIKSGATYQEVMFQRARNWMEWNPYLQGPSPTNPKKVTK